MNNIEKYVNGNKIQALTLSNDHRAKLYEMCNNIIDNNNPKCSVQLHKDMINIPVQDTDKREFVHIHWFELCTTHLSFHVCGDPLKFLKYTIDYAMMIDKDKRVAKHPIDVLYNEYTIIKDMFLNVFNSRETSSDYFLENV